MKLVFLKFGDKYFTLLSIKNNNINLLFIYFVPTNSMLR